LALRQERQVRSLARRGRRSPAMASRRERLATPRHQGRPVMGPDLEVAAEPGLLPQLVAVAVVAAEFERPHEM
jgi:hypothetical protein